MLRTVIGLLALAGAVVYWLLTELITTRFVEKLLREMTPWEERLIKFGIPIALAILCIWLLWKRHPPERGTGGDTRGTDGGG